jgi:hypothetical protein
MPGYADEGVKRIREDDGPQLPVGECLPRVLRVPLLGLGGICHVCYAKPDRWRQIRFVECCFHKLDNSAVDGECVWFCH